MHFALDAVEPLVQLCPVDLPQGANGLPDIFNFLLIPRQVRQDGGFALLRAHRVPVPAVLGFGSVLGLLQGPGAGNHRVVDRHVIAWPIQRQAVSTPVEDAPTDRGEVGGEVEPFFSFGQTLRSLHDGEPHELPAQQHHHPHRHREQQHESAMKHAGNEFASLHVTGEAAASWSRVLVLSAQSVGALCKGPGGVPQPFGPWPPVDVDGDAALPARH